MSNSLFGQTIGTKTGISIGLVFLIIAQLMAIFGAWNANIKNIIELTSKLELASQERKIAIKEREILNTRLQTLTTQYYSLERDLYTHTLNQWSKEDDRIYMEKFSEQNGLKPIPHNGSY